METFLSASNGSQIKRKTFSNLEFVCIIQIKHTARVASIRIWTMFPNAPNGQLKIHFQAIGLHGNEAGGIFYNEAKEFLLFLWEQR